MKKIIETPNTYTITKIRGTKNMIIIQLRQIHQHKNQKTRRMASRKIRGHQKNVEIISVASFIEETMKTLKGFAEQLKVQLNSNLTQ